MGLKLSQALTIQPKANVFVGVVCGLLFIASYYSFRLNRKGFGNIGAEVGWANDTL